MMFFSDLLKSAGISALSIRGDAEITEIVADSRKARAGGCFVAVRGASEDGRKYIPAAIAAGCSAVVCDDVSAVPDGIPMANVPNTRIAVARLAQAFRGWPSRKLTTVAVTGTNGKTTTTCLIRDILLAAGHQPALLGTISYETGTRAVEANQTTPDPIALADMTAEMVAAGRTHLVMETSSHALHQDRTCGLEFRVGVFTNLTGDHLDYHKTMEEYLLAKRRLFEQLPAGGAAVINQDDPVASRLATATAAHVTMVGLSPAADLRARILDISAGGTKFEMTHAMTGRSAVVDSPLIGRHNVYNCLGAAGACLALGVDIQKIADVLATVKIVPGRLERVHVDAPYQVFVDYAHTDDALVNVLGALRPVTRGRIILVFGCGGDRDSTKRPRMAKVAQQMADKVFVTSDNPRTEQPAAVIEQIRAGFSADGLAKVHFEIDRRTAIEKAISSAAEGDIVLIAGKGHEKYQIFGKDKHHFDDVEVAQQVMTQRCSEGVSPSCPAGILPAQQNSQQGVQ